MSNGENPMDLFPCSCRDTQLGRFCSEYSGGVVHRINDPCYVLDVDSFKNAQHVNKKAEAWVMATQLVEPVLKQNELKMYAIGNPFNAQSRVTPAEQHIDIITRVADWLLEKEQEK